MGVVVAGALVSTRAAASNVTEVPDNGSEQMGRGGAWVARASDPLATAFNPAGLAGQATRVTLQNGFLFHRTCISRVRAASDTSVDPLADASGRFPRVCSDIEPALNPQLGGTLRVTSRLGIGLAVLGPATAGERNWPEFVEDASGTLRPAPQRYLLTREAGLILFPTLGVGYEVIPNLRLGASFGWGIAKIKTTAATVALNSSGLDAANDVRANLQVRDFFVPRLTAGALWSVSPNVDLAGVYQWTDTIRAVGDVGTATNYYTPAVARGDESKVGYGDTIFSDCGTGRPEDAGKCGSGDNASLRLVIPMEVKFGLRYRRPRYSAEQVQAGEGLPGETFQRDPLGTEAFDVEVNVTWANNSAYESLEVRFPSDPSGGGRLPVAGINSQIPPNADQPRHYRDVYGLRLGGDFNVLPDKLALRAGAYYETSALRDQYQHIDFSPTERIGVALGATYRIRFGDATRSQALELMLGYGHTFFGDATREDRAATGIGALAGTPCPDNAIATGPRGCSDGTQRYRTRWPVNLGTITSSLNVINVGAAYRF